MEKAKGAVKNIIELMEANWQIRMLYFERHLPELEVVMEPDVTIVRSDFVDDAFNFVISARFTDQNVEKGVAHVVSLFQGKKTPICWWVGELDTPRNLDKYLKDAHFTLRAENTACYLELKNYKVTAEKIPSNFEIKRVFDQKELKDYSEIIIKVFNEPKNFYTDFYSKIPTELYQEGAPYELYVGYSEGKPVATVALLDDAGICGIYYLATLPQFRKKGYATAMLKHVIGRAKSKGRDIASLQCTSEGKELYTKFGFKECGKLREFIK